MSALCSDSFFGLPTLALGIGSMFLIVHSTALWLRAGRRRVRCPCHRGVLACGWWCCKQCCCRRAEPGTYPIYSFIICGTGCVGPDAGRPRSPAAALHHASTCLRACACLARGSARIPKCRPSGSFTPDLLAAGDASFFADGCFLGGRRSTAAALSFVPTALAQRASSATARSCRLGASLGDDCLLGVLSAPPAATRDTPDGTDWLGSPASALPNRQKVAGFDESTTFSPRRGSTHSALSSTPAHPHSRLPAWFSSSGFWSCSALLQCLWLMDQDNAAVAPLLGASWPGARRRGRGGAEMDGDGHVQARNACRCGVRMCGSTRWSMAPMNP